MIFPENLNYLSKGKKKLFGRNMSDGINISGSTLKDSQHFFKIIETNYEV